MNLTLAWGLCKFEMRSKYLSSQCQHTDTETKRQAITHQRAHWTRKCQQVCFLFTTVPFQALSANKLRELSFCSQICWMKDQDQNTNVLFRNSQDSLKDQCAQRKECVTCKRSWTAVRSVSPAKRSGFRWPANRILFFSTQVAIAVNDDFLLNTCFSLPGVGKGELVCPNRWQEMDRNFQQQYAKFLTPVQCF